MKFNIRIIGIMSYNSKDTNEEMTRIEFEYLDKQYFKNTEKFIGRLTDAKYLKGNLLSKFDANDIMNNVIFQIVVNNVPSERNPLRTTQKITEIQKNNASYILL